jgi:hypothetical protein
MTTRLAGPATAVALACACVILALTIETPGSDYRVEAQPAFDALVRGDLRSFLELAPVGYAGSLLLRAPAALAASALDAGGTGVYRAGALLCLLAAAVVAWVLLRVLLARRPDPVQAVAAVAVVLLAPAVLDVLPAGHPEEVLTGALAVGAVLAAMAGRPLWAGVALGAAIACKPWAVLAIAPVLFAAPDRRPRLCLAAAAAAGVLWAPIVLADAGAFTAESTALSGTGWIFKPQQIWWPLGTERVLPGGTVGYDGPAWVAALSHPLIVLAAAPSAALHYTRRRRLDPWDSLGLLGLLLLLRCVMDPWNCVYYAVPAVMALTAWEAGARRGLPVIGLAVTALTWLSFVGLRPHLDWDGLATVYLGWTLPLIALLAIRLYGPRAGERPSGYATSSAIAARTSASGT